MENKKTSYSYEDLLKSGNGTLFGPNSGRLPLPNMLMIDRITHISNEGGKYNKGVVVAEMDVRPDLWFFDCHFKDDPVMPGSLGLDAMLQLTGFYLTHSGYEGKGRALGCEKLHFTGQVLPTSKLITYTIDIRRVINLKLIMVISDGTLSVDGEDIYFCESMKVGLFK